MNSHPITNGVQVLKHAARWFLSLALSVAALSGCAGTAPVRSSAAHTDAARHNQRGVRAESRGEYLKAQDAFAESLRISSSIEYHDGMAVALLNSSKTYRRSGDIPAAVAAIMRAVPLVDGRSPLSGDVAREVAQVRLVSGNLDEAYLWAVKGEAPVNHPNRVLSLNLLARILILKNELSRAESNAGEALRLARERGSRDEEAYSLYLLGEIRSAEKNYPAAEELYNQALALDKTVGYSGKIAADLRALARLSLAQGADDKALKYFQRACNVSRSGGDRMGAAEDLLQMARIYEARGELKRSEQLLVERTELLKNSGAP